VNKAKAKVDKVKVNKAEVNKAKIEKDKVNKAKDKINKIKDKANKAKKMINNNTVTELVADKVVADIVIITKLRSAIKTPPNTTEDID
jgi:hypothetical protein